MREVSGVPLSPHTHPPNPGVSAKSRASAGGASTHVTSGWGLEPHRHTVTVRAKTWTQECLSFWRTGNEQGTHILSWGRASLPRSPPSGRSP